MLGMGETKRRLAAILAADVAGYSRLMGADEDGTVAALDACRAIFRGQVLRFASTVRQQWFRVPPRDSLPPPPRAPWTAPDRLGLRPAGWGNSGIYQLAELVDRAPKPPRATVRVRARGWLTWDLATCARPSRETVETPTPPLV